MIPWRLAEFIGRIAWRFGWQAQFRGRGYLFGKWVDQITFRRLNPHP